VTGVDIARAGLSKAERLASGRGVRVHWVCGTIDSLEARRLMVGLFDLIYSCGAIHYVARARRARLFAQLRAHTQEDGRAAHRAVPHQPAAPGGQA
jgi:cyclopropane fatty-acyl-phospholipid synthase-like methyltransferase